MDPIVGALSRAPVFGPCDLTFEPEDIETCMRFFDLSLTSMERASNPRYIEAMKFIKNHGNLC